MQKRKNYSVAGGLVLLVLSASASAASAQSSACRSFAFPVYFAADGAMLTPAAERALRTNSARMAGCRVDAIRISIRRGGKDTELNKRRAEAVSSALAEAGAPREVTRIDERRTPFRLFQRRVTVSVDLRPR